MYTPLEQFKIDSYLSLSSNNWSLDLNKSTIYLLLSLVLLLFINKIFIRKEIIINNKFSYIIYNFIRLVHKQFEEVLTINGNNYVSLIISLFIFIVINNIIGLVPYSFTTTSQIIITLFMSTSIIIGVTFTGIIKHNISFIKLFIPQGIPVLLVPIIFVIEIISYLSRIISLSVRLTANMVSGHILLAIISTFGYNIGIIGSILFFIPVLMIFYILEFGVAIIQGFVFSVLTATYIKDSVLLH